MDRLRSFLRRTGKPFAMAFIAVTLALSLTVTTTQKAEANPLLAAPVLLLPSGTMTVGSAVAAVSLTGPLGWGIIGVGALAVGLAATQEYWLPYVNGDWGKNKPTEASGGGTGQQYRHTMTSYTINKNSIDATYSFTGPGPGSAWYAQFGALAKCRNTVDGTVKYNAVNGYWSIGANAASWSYVRTMTLCGGPSSTWVMDAWAVGGGGGDRAGSWQPNFDNTANPAVWAASGGSQFGSLKWAKSATGWNPGDSAGFDPQGSDVTYSTTTECVRPDGTYFTMGASSTGPEKALRVPSCEEAYPGAHGTGKMTVVGTGPGGVTETLWDNPRIPASAEYPKCDPSKPGPMCSLLVTVDGKPCTQGVGTWDCANWRQIATETPARVQCSYGPYTGLALDVCNPMERAYETESGVPATEPNLDGNPSTRQDTTPSGEPYTPPRTGTGTSTPGFPTTGSTPANGETDPCLKQAWSWNPGDWVRSPVVCAIKDVFVPKQDITARSNELADRANTKVPFAWMSGPMTGPGGGSCPDWTITVPGFSQNVVCESTFTAAIVGSRTPLFGLLSTAMVWPLLRSIWYACIPVLRVTPEAGAK